MKERKNEKNAFHQSIGVLTTILLVLIIYTIWGNSALMVSTVNISSDRIASAFSNFRIAQVSDLHNAEFGESNTELIELMSEHEPDIIVINGDLIDAGHTDIEIAFDFVKKAVQIAPVYFVTGNHEANFSHYDQFKTGLEASGVTVLEDEAIQLVHNNEMITLIGLSDPDFTIKGDMFNEAPAMVNTKLNSLIDDENSYTILLSHWPELFETYVCCGVDLVLCGHAHGGQFRLPFIGGLVAPNQGLFPKYDSGLYTDGKTNMVVSRGLGNNIMYNYYSIAENATVIKNFAFILEYSMYKTFGLKYQKSVYKIQRKYRRNGIFMVPYNTKKGLKYCEFYHDGFKKKRYACSFEPDLLPQYVKYDNPNYLRTRIKLGVCELCGENTGDICMHHVKSLKSIKADNEWNTIMLAKRRKTLAVCPNCYAMITK